MITISAWQLRKWQVELDTCPRTKIKLLALISIQEKQSNHEKEALEQAEINSVFDST